MKVLRLIVLVVVALSVSGCAQIGQYAKENFEGKSVGVGLSLGGWNVGLRLGIDRIEPEEK